VPYFRESGSGTAVLPHVRVEEIEGIGHLAPLTHPDPVNPLIERFLVANQSPLSDGAASIRGAE
jgi:pimeloyl-ACP methyl ester carboxylesterase